MTRVLIVTGSVGEGHDRPARSIATQLRVDQPGSVPIMIDALRVMPRIVSIASRDAARIVYYRHQWAWDVEFFAFTRFGPGRALGRLLLSRVAAASLRRLVDTSHADVVVSTFPQSTEVLAYLRRRRWLTVPLCAVVTDLAALHYKAAPGVDLHCVAHPAAVQEVRRIAGDTAPVRVTHGLTGAEFLAVRSALEARRVLSLPASGRIVLCSGGGWGVGDVEGMVVEAVGQEPPVFVVCLCGRNDALAERLGRRFRSVSRVRIEGFTDAISDYMAAADAIIHSSGGLTILEAQMRGCAAISYGWARGHVRQHDAAFRRLGLAVVARDRAQLRVALRDALRRPRRDQPGATPLQQTLRTAPSAASLIISLAGATPDRTQPRSTQPV